MKTYITALAAFATTAIAGATIAGSTECDAGGYVKIINLCDEDIYFENTPSGFAPIDGQVLHQGDTYSQVFTALPDGGGWSMKLSPDSSFPGTNTQQYEYTWTGTDSTAVWYDMSYVNGSPYPNWNFTSSNVELCDPTSHAYRNSTDDQYGMQAQCYTDVTLTLHLCPSASGSSSSSSSGSASSVASSTPTSTSVYVAPSSTSSASVAPTTFATSASSAYSAPASSSSKAAVGGSFGNKVQVGSAGVVEEAAQTTTAAVVSTTQAPNGVIVTETQVQVVTQVQTFVVTARDAEPTPAHRHKLRHEHRHPHGGRA